MAPTSNFTFSNPGPPLRSKSTSRPPQSNTTSFPRTATPAPTRVPATPRKPTPAPGPPNSGSSTTSSSLTVKLPNPKHKRTPSSSPSPAAESHGDPDSPNKHRRTSSPSPALSAASSSSTESVPAAPFLDTSLEALARTDPRAAEQLLIKGAGYLRAQADEARQEAQEAQARLGASEAEPARQAAAAAEAARAEAARREELLREELRKAEAAKAAAVKDYVEKLRQFAGEAEAGKKRIGVLEGEAQAAREERAADGARLKGLSDEVQSLRAELTVAQEQCREGRRTFAMGFAVMGGTQAEQGVEPWGVPGAAGGA